MFRFVHSMAVLHESDAQRHSMPAAPYAAVRPVTEAFRHRHPISLRIRVLSIVHVFMLEGYTVVLVGDAAVLVGDAIVLVGNAIVLVGDAILLVGDTAVLVDDAILLVRDAAILVGDAIVLVGDAGAIEISSASNSHGGKSECTSVSATSRSPQALDFTVSINVITSLPA